MSIDFSKEVDHVVRLARLSLSSEEKEHMAGQLSDILETARSIQELDTSGIEPTSHVVNIPAPMREDQVKPSLPVSRVLQNAPSREKEYIKVPRITSPGKAEE
ncbi:MAG: Asp-tRNA(Asn)/Glu-tRNA(Gln) amidotransferase subunit GatC [Bacillota bacterium]